MSPVYFVFCQRLNDDVNSSDRGSWSPQKRNLLSKDGVEEKHLAAHLMPNRTLINFSGSHKTIDHVFLWPTLLLWSGKWKNR